MLASSLPKMNPGDVITAHLTAFNWTPLWRCARMIKPFLFLTGKLYFYLSLPENQPAGPLFNLQLLVPLGQCPMVSK